MCREKDKLRETKKKKEPRLVDFGNFQPIWFAKELKFKRLVDRKLCFREKAETGWTNFC